MSIITKERAQEIFLGNGPEPTASEERELARIALASLEAEPYGYVHKSAYEQAGSCGLSSDHEAYRDSSTHIAVYTAPPAPVAVDKIAEQAGIDPDIADAYMQGVNDTNQRKLEDIIPNVIPKGLTGQIVYLCAFDNMPRYELANRIWNACRDAMLQGAEPVTTACKLPEGWVAVPIEPTEDMIVNGFESEPDESFSDAEVWEAYDSMSGCQQAAHRAKLCWSAMISAAPKLDVG